MNTADTASSGDGFANPDLVTFLDSSITYLSRRIALLDNEANMAIAILAAFVVALGLAVGLQDELDGEAQIGLGAGLLIIYCLIGINALQWLKVLRPTRGILDKYVHAGGSIKHNAAEEDDSLSKGDTAMWLDRSRDRELSEGAYCSLVGLPSLDELPPLTKAMADTHRVLLKMNSRKHANYAAAAQSMKFGAMVFIGLAITLLLLLAFYVPIWSNGS